VVRETTLVLQQHWEISRLYAMFATPIGYLIDEAGVITHSVAVGLEPILTLMIERNRPAVRCHGPENRSGFA